MSQATPSFDNLNDDEKFSQMMVFQELSKREGLNLASSLIEECEPLILQIKQSAGENSSTYKEYSNKFVDTAITYILIQVNENIGLSLASDLNQYQKNNFKNQNAFTISLVNKLEKHYRNSGTQEYVNKIKNKVGGSEQRVNPSSSCYIATIIYNNYNSKEVYLLREYRDAVLSDKIYGRLFIHIYYTSSPLLKPIVKNSKLIQNIIRYFLDKFIIKLTAANI